MHIRALYLFHLTYFTIFSATTFLPKYFGELGMNDGQVGMLMAIPAVLGVMLQPVWGTLTDRARFKRSVLILLVAALGVVCFVLDRVTGFGAMMLGLTVFYVVHLPIAPIYGTISLEYTRQIGRAYGPIRVLGTLGYQAGAVLVGVLFVGTLRGLYRFMGIMMLVSCAIAFFLPPVEGHQHGGPKVKMSELLKDRKIVILLAMVLVGSVTSQFYVAFFSKHLGDLGIDNTIVSVLLIISVLLEIPFLIFAEKLFKKVSVWNWFLIAYGLNALRWVGFAASSNVWILMLCQVPGVSMMACFEYFPALYLNLRVPDTLQGCAQSALTIVAYGIAKVIGSLFGGFISGVVGIPTVFAANAVLLVIAVVALYRPTRRLIAEDRGEGALGDAVP